MRERLVRVFVASIVVSAIVLGGASGAVAAEDEEACETGCIDGPDASPEINNPTNGDTIPTSDNVIATKRVAEGFSNAKRAFHAAHQNIESIKKGDQSPVEKVPTFFESEDGETDENDEDE